MSTFYNSLMFKVAKLKTSKDSLKLNDKLNDFTKFDFGNFLYFVY